MINILGSTMVFRTPGVRSNGARGVVIKHSEYIRDIQPSTAFQLDNLAINPGLDSTFPWLSQVALAFTNYKWRRLTFIFKSTSADLVSGTNGALGTTMMATDYNSVDDAFPDKKTMANYEGTTACKPSMTCIHSVSCTKTAAGLLYTRDAQPPPNADIRLYDIGRFSLATEGMQGTVGTIGELWVDYEVEFFKPRFQLDAQVESSLLSANPAGGAFSSGNPSGGANNEKYIKGNVKILFENNKVYLDPSLVNKLFFMQFIYRGNAGQAAQAQLVQSLTVDAGFTNVTVLPIFANADTPIVGAITNVDTDTGLVLWQAFIQCIPDANSGQPFQLKFAAGFGNAAFCATGRNMANMFALEVSRELLRPFEQLN